MIEPNNAFDFAPPPHTDATVSIEFIANPADQVKP